ncbi:hypothetical protein ACFFHH_17215 [Cytobacillus solani]|uniref:hypothetical protein n=1 Tax=Cytobacillus solani TaxID=1637975 RepID=UPI00114E21BE|nr:hypothetical protein [Cytobacillus solani]
MKKYFQWKNIIIGIIDKNHPQSKEIYKAVDEINKVVDETFTSVGEMINEIKPYTDYKRN